MSYASKWGRASVNARNPRSFAICDRCGLGYNLDELRWQFGWSGVSLTNRQLLVCRPCLDVPNQQLRAIILPADPVPVRNPRPEYFDEDEA